VNAPIRSLLPMAHVRDVVRSIEFYRKLGFEVGKTFVPDGQTEPAWAWLHADRANLMVTLMDDPVVPEQQAVLFYLYSDDVATTRSELEKAGMAVGPIAHPFYAPRGEFRVEDPDGYVLMITHT
jgi:catechol 2,3-dioxygenase-like lactoylglutathione lyase family enzyme